MNLQKGAIGVVALAALAAGGYAIWRQTGGIRKASAGPVIVEASPRPPLISPALSLGMPRSPRLVATWTTRVGPYSVGVGSLRPMQDNRRFLGRGTFQLGRGGVGAFHLSLQVLGEGAEVHRVELDVDSVRLHDDTGAVLQRDPAAPSAATPVKFPGGLGYVLPFPAPSIQSSLLREVDGELILPSGERRRFQIRNIPLPLLSVTRLFGRLAPRRLSAADEARLPQGLAVLQREAAESILTRSAPVDRAFATNPQRLVFTQSLPASVGIPTPLEPDPVVMTATAGQMGSIEVEIRYGAESWRGKLWERDTILVALPRRGQEPRRAAAIRLTRDSVPNPPPPTTPSPFVPEPGQPGGAIVSKVLVAGRPFGQGVLQVEMRKLHGTQWSEPRVANVPIDHDGNVEMQNVAAGIYSLRRPGSSVTPEMPLREPPAPLSAYLSGRFGIRAGKWEGEQVGRIDVRNGQRAELAPLNLIPLNVKPR